MQLDIKTQMKKYFYSNGQEKEGPVTLEELKTKNILPKTLIWHEGLEDWQEATTIEEFKALFELSPPPLSMKDETKVDSYNAGPEPINHAAANNLNSSKKQTMFSSPFSFEGRIRRMEYGISLIIIYFLFEILKLIMGDDMQNPVIIVAFPLYWFLFAQGAKRCHDIGRSGWIQLVPFMVLWMIFEEGPKTANEYGRNPKE